MAATNDPVGLMSSPSLGAVPWRSHIFTVISSAVQASPNVVTPYASRNAGTTSVGKIRAIIFNPSEKLLIVPCESQAGFTKIV